MESNPSMFPEYSNFPSSKLNAVSIKVNSKEKAVRDVGVNEGEDKVCLGHLAPIPREGDQEVRAILVDVISKTL